MFGVFFVLFGGIFVFFYGKNRGAIFLFFCEGSVVHTFGNSKHKMRLFGTKNSRRVKIMVFLSFSVRAASILIGKIGNMKGKIEIQEDPKI